MAISFRKVYDTTIKKFLLGIAAIGIPVGIGLIMLLASRADITILDHSGDDFCDGTISDPCIAWVTFKANTDIFVYPMNDSGMLFGTDKSLAGLKVFRTWGTGLREYKLNESCKGTWCGLSNSADTRKFAWAWREGQTYKVYFYGFKESPDDVIKWSFTEALDPVWYGTQTAATEGNLVGHWRFEGNFLDSSGKGNHGTQVGGVQIGQGVKGRGAVFDGEDSYVNVGNTANLNFSIPNISFSLWLKPFSDTQQGIISKYGGEVPVRSLRIDRVITSGYVTMYMYNSSGDLFSYSDICAGTAIPVGSWTHLGIVLNITSINCYMNGVLKETTPLTNTDLQQVSWNWEIGRVNTGAQPEWNGSIDEVRIYNGSLTSAEIALLYNSTKTAYTVLKTDPTMGLTSESQLVGYWKFNGNVLDSSSYGNNGTVTGAIVTNEGKFKEAYKFDGYNDKITYDVVLDNITNFTLSAWIYPMEGGLDVDGGAILAKSVGGFSRAFWLNYGHGSDSVSLYMSNSTSSNICTVSTGAGTVTARDWWNVVAVFNTTGCHAYLNGVYKNSDDSVEGLVENPTGWSNPLVIGWETGNRFFNGTIDEVRIYNRSLSATEVAALYNGTKSNYFVLKSDPSLGLTDESQLVGYWKMNGNALDSSSYGNNGTVSGAIVTNLGMFKEAYSFDGVNDIIDLYNGNSLQMGTNNYTISAWIKTASASSGSIYERHSAYPIYFMTIIGGYLRGRFAFNATEAITSNADGDIINDNTWHHVAVVFNRENNMTRYVDGKISGTPTNISGWKELNMNSTGTLRIGASSGLNTPFNGTIDELRVYNKVFSSTEIADLYNGTKSNYYVLREVIG